MFFPKFSFSKKKKKKYIELNNDIINVTFYFEICNLKYYRDKIRTGSVSSGEFSEYDEGGGEFGSGVKINEWQAAWNVTNAIQVFSISRLSFKR